jgi:AcrR family transcriptional regulator
MGVSSSGVRSASGRRRGRPGGVPGVRRARNSPEGRARVDEVQRARIVRGAFEVLREHGYAQFSIARVTSGARVSRRTFYDLFSDREDCFLAVFEEMADRARTRVLEAYTTAEGDGGDWCECVRAGLTALLELFDEEPALASVLVVDALRADARVLECRARVLASLGKALHAGGLVAARGDGADRVSPVTGEGVVGGALAVLHNRLSGGQPGRLLGLRNTLMAMIVLPYLGAEAAQRELERPRPRPLRRAARRGKRDRSGEGLLPSGAGNPLAGVPVRWTYRTARVLEAVAEHPGASNRVIGQAAETSDQGQISKLLARLEKLGLIENTSGNGHKPTGEPNAWCLTARGREIESALRVRPARSAPEIHA